MDDYTEFEQFDTRYSDDGAKYDAELWCWKCEAHLCDIEQGDGLDTLARVAGAHRDECKGMK